MRKLPWLIIPLLWVGMMVSWAWSEGPREDGAVSILATDYVVHQPELGSKWYLISRAGEPVGYRRVLTSEQEVVDRPYLLAEESKLRLPIGGSLAVVAYEIESELDSTFSPALMRGEIRVGQIEVAVRGERIEQDFHLEVDFGEETTQRVIPVGEGMLTTAGFYARLASLNWEKVSERRFAVFDPVSQAPREYAVRYQGEHALSPDFDGLGRRFELRAMGIGTEVVLDGQGNLYSESGGGLLVEQADLEAVSAIYREF